MGCDQIPCIHNATKFKVAVRAAKIGFYLSTWNIHSCRGEAMPCSESDLVVLELQCTDMNHGSWEIHLRQLRVRFPNIRDPCRSNIHHNPSNPPFQCPPPQVAINYLPGHKISHCVNSLPTRRQYIPSQSFVT